jgi:hypothetical protein
MEAPTMVEIVSRGAWGANPLHTSAGAVATPTPELWLHHTASTGIHGAAGMRQLQAAALAEGYADIEYSFLVDNPTPTIYEGRGAGRQPAATADHNAISHAICVFGNFEVEQPSDALIAELGALVGDGHARGWWPATITGPHRDASGNSTACCGRNLIARIADINAIAAGAAPPAAVGGDDDMPASKDFVDALATEAGAWRLQYDGGVETIRGAFYGSYFTLAAKDRNDPAPAAATPCTARAVRSIRSPHRADR